MRVYILLYNVGTDNEGIHTLQTTDSNIILMFESEDDATRYALLLEAQDFLSPTVETIDSKEIEDFCQDSGYDYKYISEGMLEIPPEKNVESPEWNPEGDYMSNKEDEMSAAEMSKAELDRIRRQLEGLL